VFALIWLSSDCRFRRLLSADASIESTSEERKRRAVWKDLRERTRRAGQLISCSHYKTIEGYGALLPAVMLRIIMAADGVVLVLQLPDESFLV
jgi:hypothetical protein